MALVDARTIGVQPFEKKMAATIEKAIRDADLGLNPSAQGDMIRVPTPPMRIISVNFYSVLARLKNSGFPSLRDGKTPHRK